jgi:Macrocin-O-methyltransferase (TylF)
MIKSFKTETEQEVGKSLESIFVNCADCIETKLENFTKYVRRQPLKRFLAMYEIFKLILPVKGSIVECGVFRGFSVMAWAKLSAILEPENLTRRIYGFDSFAGFPSVSDEDRTGVGVAEQGELQATSYDELLELIRMYDQDRFLGHISKVQLIRGDATKTIPEFIHQNSHTLVSLLFLDFDLYEPTKVALEQLVPRMPKGSVLAFDELDNPIWPGETKALLDTLPVNGLKIRRLEWDPYIGYALLE